MKKHFRFILCLLPFFLLSASAIAGKKQTEPLKKVSRSGVYQGYSEKEYNGFDYTSVYLTTRDSVLLATDVFLPKNMEKGKKVPTILALTRYVRSIKAKFPINVFTGPILSVVSKAEVEYFTSHGYAYVVVDVRGTGASQGLRRMEFSPEEVADGNDIVNWIISQKWSDTNVGTTGISYLGTTAEMLLVNKHPNVKACIPRSSIFDLYDNVIFPGGVCQGPFVDVWGLTTRSLDNNDYHLLTDKYKFINGIHPVKGDRKQIQLKQALALHKTNFDVYKGLQDLRYRDDIQVGANACTDIFSVHSNRQAIQESGTPIYRIGGWYDGALAKGSLIGALNTSNTQKVLIGPWDHGPHDNVSPFAASKKIDFDLYGEMLRFFDYHLKGIKNGINTEAKFTYYTVGEENWSQSNNWPPTSEKPLTFYLSATKNLVSTTTNIENGTLPYTVDYTACSGNTSRWNSVTALYKNGPTNYVDRAKEDEKLICFNSEKLAAPLTITGHPVLTLNFAADADDATVFCYLEDVAPDGSVTYITEGVFRPSQCAVKQDASYKTPYPFHSYKRLDAQPYTAGKTVQISFDLLPISYQVKKDHAIRIAIAGADAGHFNLPDVKPQKFEISTSQSNASFIDLPVVSN